MKKIAIFASGNGSNAENIAKFFKNNQCITVSLILANNPSAFVLERAKTLNIPSYVFNRNDFYKTEKVLDILKNYQIDFIVLAGFLWLIPQNLIDKYFYKIINIHPALLPKYGGKGMFGTKVHEAIHQSGDTETGITIHYVNEKYDAGKIIFQSKIPINKEDTPETIAEKVHILEYENFPKTIEDCILRSS